MCTAVWEKTPQQKTKKKKSQQQQISPIGTQDSESWLPQRLRGPAVSMKAFNRSKQFYQGGRSDSSSLFQSDQPWQPPDTGGESFQGSLFLWSDRERESPKPCDPF